MTASLLSFTPLYGAKSDDPFCFLLKIGSISILLDCGWNEQFDVALLEPLIKVLPQVDLVLLSHPDTSHLGALPYLVGRKGLRAPVYAAAPLAKLGPMFMYDQHTSLHAVSDFNVFGPEDIDAAFDAITALKHHQLLELEVRGMQLRLLGYPAGHMVGGTVWVVESGGEVVVYAVDTNHIKERHLNGGQLPNVPSRPALLILDAARAHAKALNRSSREKALEEALLGVLRRQGSVLMPVDSAGRMLEMLLLLEKMWARSEPKLPYPLALLSCVASSTVHAARGMLEWMSDELQREFNITCINPLQCKNVTLCHSVADIARLPPGPKVVLATGLSLDHGMARQLLLQWGADQRNAVLFTQQPRAGTLAADLLSPRPPGPLSLSLTVGRRVRLEGAELEAFEAQRAAAEAEAAAAGAEDAAAAAAAAALPLRESSGVISQLKRSTTGGIEQVLVGDSFDVFGSSGLADEGVLMDGFAPPPGAMYCMFPDEQELLQQEWDAYGAVVDTSELRKTEESLDTGTAAAEDEDLEAEDAPTKIVKDQVNLCFAAQTSLVEGFSGCSDGRSLRTIVASLAPRGLVLVGGSPGDTADMAGACGRELPHHQTRVYTPDTGEEVRLRLAASYPISISAALLHGLSRHTLSSSTVTYEVAWLDGQIGAAPGKETTAADGDGAAGASTSAGAAAGSKRKFVEEAEPDFMLLPPGTAAAAGGGLGSTGSMHAATAENGSKGAHAAAGSGGGGEAMEVDHAAGAAAAEGAAAGNGDAEDSAACGDHGGIFIGDVKLSEVKQALAAAGVPSEFQSGRLVVGGVLVVRRDGPDGQLLMEGPLCDDYFKVRDVVYGQYNVC